MTQQKSEDARECNNSQLIKFVNTTIIYNNSKFKHNGLHPCTRQPIENTHR